MPKIDSPARETPTGIDAGRRLLRGYRWWNLLGGLLIAAAILKIQDAVEGYYKIVALAEFSIGCLVLAGVGNSFTKGILKIVFLCFMMVAVAYGLQGRRSCSCFGSAQVSPWVILALDSAVFAAIWLLKEGPCRSPAVLETPIRLTFAAVAALAFALLIFVWPDAAPKRAIFGGGGGAGVFEPGAWAGRRFPLTDRVRLAHPDVSLELGEWLVVLYEDGCPECRETVPRVLRWAVGRPEARVALLDVGLAEESPRIGMNISEDARERIVVGSLDGSLEWFFRTPTLLVLRDGRVAPDEWPLEFETQE